MEEVRPYYTTTDNYKKNPYIFDFYRESRDNTIKWLNSLDFDYTRWSIITEDKLNELYIVCKEEEELIKFYNQEESDLRDFKIKSITQNNYKFGIDKAILMHKNKVKDLKYKMFRFLDTLEDPYKHIFHPVWQINTYANLNGYYPYQVKGVNDASIYVAGEYAMYKINKK